MVFFVLEFFTADFGDTFAGCTFFATDIFEAATDNFLTGAFCGPFVLSAAVFAFRGAFFEAFCTVDADLVMVFFADDFLGEAGLLAAIFLVADFAFTCFFTPALAAGTLVAFAFGCFLLFFPEDVWGEVCGFFDMMLESCAQSTPYLLCQGG